MYFMDLYEIIKECSRKTYASNIREHLSYIPDTFVNT